MNGYNPDILTCLANLSADEVFTPPKLASAMLDILPQELFRRPDTTFLDPVCKSGVFLREIASRLNEGLRDQMPDTQARLNHIFTKQIFGLAITELTALLSRRSVYCSKKADGKYSVSTGFTKADGNIRLPKTEHTWNADGRCESCGANRGEYERDETREAYAYPFIHGIDPTEVFSVKFDVIIGNPPYQLSDGGGMGTSATPIYQYFVEQAQKLEPRYLTMVIPSRWFSGGRGLDDFREAMLADARLSKLVDYPDAAQCFPGIDLSGGVCYFLWEKDREGECNITTVFPEGTSTMCRHLLEKGTDTFIRYNEAIPIVRKIRSHGEESFSTLVSANDAFGFDSRVENGYKRIKPKFSRAAFDGAVKFFYNGWKKEGVGFIEREKIQRNAAWIDEWKVFISKAYGERGSFPYLVLASPFVVEPNSCCTETYLVLGPCRNRKIAENLVSYVQTKFFRFLVLLLKNTQNGMKKVYSLVPVQSFEEPWSDEKLFKKYGLDEHEIAFIEKMIRPLEE